MSNRVLAFIVCLPIAGLIGFAAGRATSGIGIVAEMPAPDGQSSVRIVRTFSLGGGDERVVLSAGGVDTDVRAIADGESAGEIMWAPDASLAGVVISGSKLAVIDPASARILYELPLLEQQDGTRVARGIGFSANAIAITFDDCPKRGAGCRPRFMALPVRN
jgi:hypothetical protein